MMSMPMRLSSIIKQRNKIPAILRALFRARRLKSHGPKTIQIENTNRCNLKCVMCSHRYHPPKCSSDMPLDDFKRIVDEIADLGALHTVHIQGLGEPLLHRDFTTMVQHVHNLGLRTHTITNMTVMTPDMAAALVKSGLNLLAVSLDSMNQEMVAFIRQGVHFDVLSRVLDNIALVRSAKELHESITPEIEVYMLAMRATLPELPDMVEKLSHLGIRRLCLQNIDVNGLEQEEWLPNGQPLSQQSLRSLSKEECRQVVLEMRSLSTETFEVVPPHLYDEDNVVDPAELGIVTCLDLWERPAIALDGVVTPCCYTISSKSLNMGNLNQHSFREIWFGEAYRQLRLQHLTGRPPGPCRGCSQMFQLAAPFSKRRGAAANYPHQYNEYFL